MLKSKQKSFLKSYAHSHDLVKINIGKDLISPEALQNIENALRKHELVKVYFLKSAIVDKEDLNQLIIELSSSLNCEIVQKIGHSIVIYKENKKSPLHINII